MIPFFLESRSTCLSFSREYLDLDFDAFNLKPLTTKRYLNTVM
jgi:hypothetical protein